MIKMSGNCSKTTKKSMGKQCDERLNEYSSLNRCICYKVEEDTQGRKVEGQSCQLKSNLRRMNGREKEKEEAYMRDSQ